MPASFQTIGRGTAGALVCTLICAGLFAPTTNAQQPAERGRQGQPEVLRVYTELVQTDVMVFDQQGKFVTDLKREDFELKIDGKLRPVEFFERVIAGSPNEERQLAAARGAAGNETGTGPAGAVPLDRGRPIFFYIDDLHLSLSGVNLTKKLLTKFIDEKMGQNDEAAISSASGQIGFLQQLTDNKTVLRTALERLRFRSPSIRDMERPTMTEFHALLIEDSDTDISNYFVEALLKDNPGMTPEIALSLVKGRARSLLAQSGTVTSNSLAGLESLVKSAKDLPGRKLVFFISEGFLIDRRNSDVDFRLQRITSAAAKSGVVIYSIDARGLVSGLQDASTSGNIDLSGRLQAASMSEVTSSQDGMNALARDTGGKAFFNSNSLEPAVERALSETATYYLLAWKPDQEAKGTSKFRRIEVKVPAKRGLTVLVRRGFFDVEPVPEANKKDNPKKPPIQAPPATALAKVIGTPFPQREIPISLHLNYLNLPDRGLVLSALMHVPRAFFTFTPVNGKDTAVIEVAGSLFNAKGQRGAQFKDEVTVTANSDSKDGQDLAYGQPIFLAPGLYHVRVAARDKNSGRVGSAHGWIEVPDLAKGQLALSSLLLGIRSGSSAIREVKDENSLLSVSLSIDRRFSNTDYLRFLVYVYNATKAATDGKPDIAIQVQVVRDEQPVVTTPLKKITIDSTTDLGRVPYAAEVNLAGLPSGLYYIKITAVDRVTKSSASQQTRFEIQ